MWVGCLVAQSCPRLATPWTVASQAPLSMGFPKQEYWSGLPFPSPEDLPDPGIEPWSPTLQADSLPTELRGKPLEVRIPYKYNTASAPEAWSVEGPCVKGVYKKSQPTFQNLLTWWRKTFRSKIIFWRRGLGSCLRHEDHPHGFHLLQSKLTRFMNSLTCLHKTSHRPQPYSLCTEFSAKLLFGIYFNFPPYLMPSL